VDTVVTSSAEKIHIILVHGTWGRGILLQRRRSFLLHRKRWFEDGSTFGRSLDNELKGHLLDGTVRAFLWSGANSVTERASAAIKLADELETVLRAPNTRAVIIAHSHGGNIALCALKHLKVEEKRVLCITLGTPFIQVYLNKLPLHHSAYMTDFALPGLLLMIAMIYIEARFFPHLEPSIGILVPSIILTIYSFGIIMFLRRRPGVNWTRLRKIQEEASYRPKDLQELKMIVIRGVDDEASLALAVGSIGARIGRLFLSQVMKVVYLLMSSLTLIGYGVNNTIGATFGFQTPHWYNITIGILLIIVLILPIAKAKGADPNRASRGAA